MTNSFTYSVLLTLGLIVFFSIGNLTNDTPRTLSTFPYLLSLVPFPIVLYPLLKREAEKKAQPKFSVSEGLRVGEAVVRWAALAFAIFTMLYAFFYFGSGMSALMLASGVMTFFGTWIIGVVIAAICSWILVKRMPGNEASNAA